MIVMTNGVEIVIKPRHIERVVFSLIIIALAVLLVVKWNGGGGSGVDTSATGAALTEAGLNETNQTASTTKTETLCDNGVKDQDETDVDCGGSKCDPCAEFKNCNTDSDCESDYCHEHIKCLEASCDDGIKNQDESNVDCGGRCGGFFYDGECHEEPQPQYSGRVELTILDVETSINEFDDNENAKIDSVEFKVENGKSENVVIYVYLYALSESGRNIFGTDPYTGDDRLLTDEVNIPLLSPGESHTETVNVLRTLIETDPNDEYQIVVELRDEDTDKLLNEKTWENK